MGQMDSLDELFHKEKYQKKNNMATGQIDNLKKYGNETNTSIGKSSNQPTPDKLIKREANFIKNIHIDDTISKLKIAGLLMTGYDGWYAQCLHTLGVAYVSAQADIALNKGKNPQALFHFLINKAMNKSSDPYGPRIHKPGQGRTSA